MYTLNHVITAKAVIANIVGYNHCIRYLLFTLFLVIVDNAVTDTPDTLIVLALCYMLLFANSTVNPVIIEQ